MKSEQAVKQKLLDAEIGTMVHRDPLWDFEIENTGRKVGELITCVATLMRHGYRLEAQGIAHQAAALTMQLEAAIRERNEQPTQE